MSVPTFDRDTGLAAMIAAARPGDHGVLADWIEDHLQHDDLAAVLRAGLDAPAVPKGDETSYHKFRFRRLDHSVLLTTASYTIWPPTFAKGPRRENLTGFVVCLCTPPEAPGGMRRIDRWFPTTLAEPALTRLLDDLAGGKPEEPR